MTRRLNICLTCSHGGHLTEMRRLEPAFEGHNTFYFCYDAPTTRELDRAYRVPNMARNPIELIKNLFRLVRIFRKERPDLIVSTGAEIAIPVVCVGKLFRVPAVYIECGAQVTTPSFTGRLLSRFVERFFVQWPELLPVYEGRARLAGSFADSVAPFTGDRSHEPKAGVAIVRMDDADVLGAALLASALQRGGVAVRVIDARAESLNRDTIERLLDLSRPDTVVWLRGAADDDIRESYGLDFQFSRVTPEQLRDVLARIGETLGLVLAPEVCFAEPGFVPDWSLFPRTLNNEKAYELPLRIWDWNDPSQLRSVEEAADEWRTITRCFRPDNVVLDYLDAAPSEEWSGRLHQAVEQGGVSAKSTLYLALGDEP